MNERIKELELQCYVEITKTGLDGCSSNTSRVFDKEKFAELIVKECAKCITTGTYSADPPYDRIIPVLLDVLTNNMIQYFGVEK